VSISSRYRHTLVVKRMAPATATAAETVGGPDTTLTADTLAGAQAIEVADVAGVETSQWLRVGTEIREVGTVIALVVVLSAPLELAHASGDQVRQVDDSGIAVDDYGQAIMAETTVATVPGLIQMRTARDIAQANQAGAVIGEYRGWLDPLPGLTTDCWIELAGPTGMAGRYDVVFIDNAAGLDHHFEVGCQKVGP
jgi:hypothetical protein